MGWCLVGLKDLKAVSPHTSLAELGMDSMMAVEIKQTLEREFELFLTAQDIRGLNFAKLQEILAQDISKKSANGGDAESGEILTGMKLLVRVIGNDQISNETCLALQTRAEPGRTEIFLVPGIEGFGNVFKGLTPKLKSPACALQLGNDDTQCSINAMADKLVKVKI